MVALYQTCDVDDLYRPAQVSLSFHCEDTKQAYEIFQS